MLLQAMLTVVLVYLGWHLLRDPDTVPAAGFLDRRGKWMPAALAERPLDEAAAYVLHWHANVQLDAGAAVIRFHDAEEGPTADGAEGPGPLPYVVSVPR
jgi:hypothetical protein